MRYFANAQYDGGLGKLIAFSLVELMISLITISCIAAAFTPVITKKLKKQDVALSLAQTSEISDNCGKESGKNFGNDTDGYNCKLCTKAYCIQCGLTDCGEGKYIDIKTCTCKRCKEDAGLDNCLACKIENSTAVCTKCQEGNGNKGTGFYLQKESESKPQKTCRACGSNNFCDDGVWEKTVSQCANPPSGYYCKDGKKYECYKTYGNSCVKCTDKKCTGCDGFYFINTSGVCVPCGISGCINCSSCNNTNKTSCPICNACNSPNYISSSNTCTPCASGEKATPNCDRCDDNGRCNTCLAGYYLNSAYGCTACTLANCQYCKDGNAASSPACKTCFAGNYLSSGKCYSCASKFGANCTLCDSTKCLSCVQGYIMEAEKSNPACINNENGAFDCSDSNFMRVGDKCITRRNMGDSSVLKIPSSVTTVEVGEYCYARSEKCCWKGKTANACNSDNGSYSGCNRTVCNWDAGYDICENFNYRNAKWEMVTDKELTDFYNLSYNTGDNGPMMCKGNGLSNCTGLAQCFGSQNNTCYPNYIWSGTPGDGIHQNVWLIESVLYRTYYNAKSNTGGVRCMTDMSNFKL